MYTERNLTGIVSKEWLADECIQKYYETNDTIHTMVGRYIDLMIGFVCKADTETCLTLSLINVATYLLPCLSCCLLPRLMTTTLTPWYSYAPEFHKDL